jgi:hypothetical protein
LLSHMSSGAEAACFGVERESRGVCVACVCAGGVGGLCDDVASFTAVVFTAGSCCWCLPASGGGACAAAVCAGSDGVGSSAAADAAAGSGATPWKAKLSAGTGAGGSMASAAAEGVPGRAASSSDIEKVVVVFFGKNAIPTLYVGYGSQRRLPCCFDNQRVRRSAGVSDSRVLATHACGCSLRCGTLGGRRYLVRCAISLFFCHSSIILECAEITLK